ncbi:hypothetical protein [Pseudolysinimonas sp.]|jgi:hypothetical protein|uniref:hypothetical protein n=1 Tax=Pseudolysinimonas sp. TaxID=2680009 RepID=UPI003783AF1A
MRATARRSTARRIAGVAVIGLALPLAACSTGDAGGVGLVREGCPADIRIQTDDLPRVEWGFLYGLLDADELRIGDDSVSAPLLIDGEPSGSTLTILVGDPDDGVSGSVALHDDESILLAAVDTDAAILDAARTPSVGVFAPMRRDSQIVYWSTTVYEGVRTIRAIGDRLTPDGLGLVPFVTAPNDPFTDYAIGAGLLSADQVVTDAELGVPGFVEAGGVSSRRGDLLVDPYRLALPEAGSPQAVAWQLIDDIGYQRDAGVLSARPQALVQYADCLGVLVPTLQRALVDYLDDPDATTELLVELSAEFGDPAYDAASAHAALDLFEAEDLVGAGRDGTIGDLDFGRLRHLIDRAVPVWEDAEVAVPADVEAEDIATNRFIDRSIG